MAISTTSKKPLSLLAFITIHLLLQMVNSQEGTYFIFESFGQGAGLIRQGDTSYSSSGALQLTKVDNRGNPLGGSVGRALYSETVPLYDKSTGKVSSIATSFRFAISTPSSGPPADGLAFFFASPDTTIPPNSGGAFLGLFSSSNARNNSRNELIGFKASSDKVVAVEFDTYPNRNLGDPNYKHVGIDVNSIVSKVTRRWNWENGQLFDANVIYDPWAKTLTVTTSYAGGSRIVDFTYPIDLTTVLPERVRVGFSGATGLYSQVNNVISWSYNSILVDVNAAEKGGIASVV